MAIVFGVVIAVGLMTTIADMIALHPYESVYFNRLIAGGLRAAAGSYETDYWGNSYREGVEWLVTHYGPSASATQPIRVASCSHPLSTRYFLPADRFRYVFLSEEPADVFLATTRWHCDESVPGRVVHRVQRQGVTLLYIKELTRVRLGTQITRSRRGHKRNRQSAMLRRAPEGWCQDREALMPNFSLTPLSK